MRFTKMHGLGNDYVYVDCFSNHVADPVGLSRVISDRHRGVGGDGLILIGPSSRADVRMEMYNADGSRAQMCGNGVRCVAKYSWEHGLVRRSVDAVPGVSGEDMARVRDRMTAAVGYSGESGQAGGVAEVAVMSVETDAGVKALGLLTRDVGVQLVCVNMGCPSLKPADLPCTLDGDRVVDRDISIAGQTHRMTCVSVGNPHAVIFVDDLSSVDLPRQGSVIENAPIFPQRINVHFARVNSPEDVTMVTWERGSGITQACGTGATAVCVAGASTRRCKKRVLAHLPGGDLLLDWADDNHVYMTGPATEVFSGEWPG